MAPESGRKRRVTNDRVLTVFRESDNPFLATGEVLEELKDIISRPTLLRRLNELVENGRLEMRETSGANIYWLPGRVADDPDRFVSPDKLVLDLDERLKDDLEDRANEEDKTPERLAKELLADALAGPPLPHWELTKTLGFAFSLIFLGFAVVVQLFTQGIIFNIAIGIAGVAMILFAISFITSVLAPVAGPVVDELGDWWDSLRE